MKELSDYTHPRETWWLTDHNCPSCGQQYASNGRVYKCNDCGLWKVIEE